LDGEVKTMPTLFAEDKPYSEVVAGLRSIGYTGELLQENYAFRDYFRSGLDERRIDAVAFGQTPVSYDSACIAVACTNGACGASLVNQYRALGAPFLLEIDKHEIREWAVSGKEDGHAIVERYSTDTIHDMFVNRAPDWKPEPLLRAKNIGSFHWTAQLGLFAGLLPELEEEIQSKLEPLLHETLSETKQIYQDSAGRLAEPPHLFKLIFWLLTAKVFHDRNVPGFVNIGSDPDTLLEGVAKQHRTSVPRLLNRAARETAAALIWTNLDFRNLSVEVLSQMWAGMLIDDQTKKELQIQRTSRTIVRYVVEHVMSAIQPGDDKRIILEPCSGSAVFLVGAMNYLRQTLYLTDPPERHQYFVKHLAAVETDPFGVEISRLALTLADFPNPNNWEITQADVFEPGVLTNLLQRAGVVFCNPPFGDFTNDERQKYAAVSPKKPVELLDRVLSDLNPTGILGFVLPRNIIDGQNYKEVRKRLAKRFASLELTALPDRAFEADSETALLVATEPIPHNSCRVVYRSVNDTATAWREFELRHAISAEFTTNFEPDQAFESLAIPQLPEIWDYLHVYPTLGEVAEVHRGIEWNKPLATNRQELVRDEPTEGFVPGVAPRTDLFIFETPEIKYLSVKPEDQRRGGYLLDWQKPKAIIYKFARSRGPWRMAAFPDNEGLACSGAYIGVWPRSPSHDEWTLAAILNSPLANAFVATREGKFHVTIETLKLLPMPYFTDAQRGKLKSLILSYHNSVVSPMLSDDPGRLLMEIDALVLAGYRMPPKLEHELLDYFYGNSSARPTRHPFREYLPPDCEVHFSLAEYLSSRFAEATAGELRKRMGLV
jgi:hypothetical protein